MSYARMCDDGIYIWSDGENLNFNIVRVPENDINIFLAKLYDTRQEEFFNRVEQGRKLIEQFKVEVNKDG